MNWRFGVSNIIFKITAIRAKLFTDDWYLHTITHIGMEPNGYSKTGLLTTWTLTNV